VFATATLVADTINTAELANGPAVGTRADVICAPRAPCAAPRGAADRPRAAACLAEHCACFKPKRITRRSTRAADAGLLLRAQTSSQSAGDDTAAGPTT